MTISNAVCKTIMETNDVTQQKLGEVLLSELVSSGKITKDEAAVIHRKLQQVLHEQTNSLIDRVLDVL